MNREKLFKLAEVLSDEEFEAVAQALVGELDGPEDLDKTAKLDKNAEYEAAWVLGEYAAAAYDDEMEKLSEALDEEMTDDEGTGDVEKVAAAYEEFGREKARTDFLEMIKTAAGEFPLPVEEKDKEEPVDDDEKKKEKKDKEEPKDKMKDAKAKLMAAIKNKSEVK